MSLIPQKNHRPLLNNSFYQQLLVLSNNETILKGWWKSFQESTSIPLSLLFCHPFICLLTLCYMIPSLYPTSLPLHQLWRSSYPSTDLFQFPKPAWKKVPGKLFAHKLFYLPTSSVSHPVCWKAKFVQWSAQSTWAVTEGAVCLWRHQMQRWKCSLWQSEV